MRILLSLTAIFISIIAIGQPVNLPKDSTTISAVPRINPDQWEAEHTTAYPGEPEQFFKRADAVLTGKINGYDPSTCFHYIRMYNDNLITREVDSGENSNSTTTAHSRLPFLWYARTS